MTIGERIKQRRKELGMSQEELAQKVGYKSRTSINKIELDERNLTQRKIKIIADALETTPEYIMGWSNLTMSIGDRWLLTPEEYKEKEDMIGQLNSSAVRRLVAYWAAFADLEKVEAVASMIKAMGAKED